MRVLLFCALALGSCKEASTARPPNLVLLSIDTLRPDHLSCYGYARPTSPTIDSLAEAGTLFEDVTASSPWTAPSHATMLTGLYPAHHGVLNVGARLRAEIVTLAEELERGGYQTLAAVNSINIGLPGMELDQGFLEFEWIEESGEDELGRFSVPNRGRKVVAAAEAMLERRDPTAPFFLFLHVYDVHADLTPEQRYRDEFVGEYSGPMNGTVLQYDEIQLGRQSADSADMRWLVEMYDAEIRQVDDLVAGFVAHLEAQGLLDETILVLTSDHGEEFFERGGLGHCRTHYQEVLAIPLILRGPGVPRGLRVKDPIALVDVVPTILGLAGIEPRGQLDGIDLTAFWNAPETIPEARPLFAGADISNVVDGRSVANHKAVVRIGDHKLHLDRLTMTPRLYDLSKDPGEVSDISRSKPRKVRQLMRALDRLLSTEVEASVSVPVSDEDLERLDALGYGGG